MLTLTVNAPSVVSPGQDVAVGVVVGSSQPAYVTVTGEGVPITLVSPQEDFVDVDTPVVFYIFFIMPTTPVTLRVVAWYWDNIVGWASDAVQTVTINPVTPKARGLQVAYIHG